MDKQKESRCPHFQLYAQPLDIEQTPNVLAIRRCMLAERLIGLLLQTPNGAMLTQKLTVRIDSGKDFAIVGPDLESVTRSACTVERCEERCTPAYVAHLEYFGGTDPRLEEVTCSENSEETGESERSKAISARGAQG